MREIGKRIWHDVKAYWAAAAALALYTIMVNLLFHHFCPMVIISGLPCPGCGLTRSFIYLASGRIQQSIYINPMGIPIAAILIYFFWNRYILGREAKWMMRLIIIAVVMLLVLYFYRMYVFFPNRVPYIYNEGNVLSQVFVFYDEILHEAGIL